MQAARDERIEKEVSLDALKQVEMGADFSSPEFISFMNLTGRTSECKCGSNVYLPSQRWQVANINFIISQSLMLHRHCHFTAVIIRFGPDISYLSKVA